MGNFLDWSMASTSGPESFLDILFSHSQNFIQHEQKLLIKL